MMTLSKAWLSVLAASAVGLVTITVYLVVARAVLTGTPVVTGLEQLLQWDASNAYGDAAYSGGWTLAVIGLLMDAVVSTCWAAVFVILYLNVPIVARYPLLAGLLFGAAVMCIMIYLVVPIGHARQGPRTLVPTINTLIAHSVFFGLPLALTVQRMLRSRSTLSQQTTRPSRA
jgi:hypothetical protein